MARRRYISTSISTDTRVNRLVADCGDFAALLYTWAIPHAADDGSLPADPEELLLLVAPGHRSRTAGDVQVATDKMVALGLLHRLGDRLYFPESFYTYQSYISDQRKSARPARCDKEQPQNAADLRETAQSTADQRWPLEPSSDLDAGDEQRPPVSVIQRETAQNAADQRETALRLSSSSSLSSSSGLTTSAVGRKNKAVKPLTDEARVKLHADFDAELGAAVVAQAIEEALDHDSARKYSDMYLYVRGWLRRDAERKPRARTAPARAVDHDIAELAAAQPVRRQV